MQQWTLIVPPTGWVDNAHCTTLDLGDDQELVVELHLVASRNRATSEPHADFVKGKSAVIFPAGTYIQRKSTGEMIKAVNPSQIILQHQD